MFVRRLHSYFVGRVVVVVGELVNVVVKIY